MNWLFFPLVLVVKLFMSFLHLFLAFRKMVAFFFLLIQYKIVSLLKGGKKEWVVILQRWPLCTLFQVYDFQTNMILTHQLFYGSAKEEHFLQIKCQLKNLCCRKGDPDSLFFIVFPSYYLLGKEWLLRFNQLSGEMAMLEWKTRTIPFSLSLFRGWSFTNGQICALGTYFNYQSRVFSRISSKGNWGLVALVRRNRILEREEGEKIVEKYITNFNFGAASPLPPELATLVERSFRFFGRWLLFYFLLRVILPPTPWYIRFCISFLLSLLIGMFSPFVRRFLFRMSSFQKSGDLCGKWWKNRKYHYSPIDLCKKGATFWLFHGHNHSLLCFLRRRRASTLRQISIFHQPFRRRKAGAKEPK